MIRSRLWRVVVFGALATAAAGAKAQDVTLWGVDPLTKVMKDAAPPGVPGPARLEGAAGETVSGQVVFRPAMDRKKVAAAVTDLRNGALIIPAADIRLQWVRYIDVKRNTAGVPEDELVAKAPCSLPDPFWEAPAVDVPARSVQPLWIEVEIPSGAAPGEYSGALTLRWHGDSVSLPLRLTVWAFDMPTTHHQQITNWFAFPGVGYNVAWDSKPFWDLAGKFAKAIAAHRQTCFMADLSWIKTTYDAKTGYKCDFRFLDTWAETFFAAGLERLELFSAGKPSASVDDPACRILPADLAVAANEPGITLTPEHKLRGVLEQIERHVREKNWQGRVMIHISDEPFMHCVPTYLKIADIVHHAAPSLKVIEAVEATGFGDAIDVLVPKLSHLNLWWPYFRRAQSEGKEVWFYTCCHPLGRYPNRFLDQPLVKMRALHWICYLYRLDGYLHWGLNQTAADVDPYSEDGISQGLPLGDRAVMYPGKNGPVGSMRWSTMRDGLQDYEYLYVLERRLSELKKRLGDGAAWLDPRQRPLELCRRVVTSFYDHTRNPGVLLDTRREIAAEIEAVSQPSFLYVQTEPCEGTTIPDGPRWIIVRGVGEPGAVVKVNDSAVSEVGPDGVFAAACHLASDRVTVEALKDGKSRKVTRSFRFLD